MEVLTRDRELTILVDSESQRSIEQTVNGVKDIRANIALNVDGRVVDLPKDVSTIMMSVLESLGKGSRVVISTTPKELRTTAAAEMLGISRPTLLKLVRAGELPSHNIGAHHRFFLADVLEYRAKQQRAKRERFLAVRDSLAELDS
ncbi:helix-turn-helix domain-containing protein [Bifidobacterium leontopitheci]|uniref:Excisionase n=1 Tax=Bifidobacterium leontopitheci TaxID=2650774 RepID=A0A6I1GTG7_9BIFI|nr:helix-turn-helix domain-containing protein [Bifidobacterium leontopitheci]KAB7789751.1 excisionase [Bifidobacterium leontopitheci]